MAILLIIKAVFYVYQSVSTLNILNMTLNTVIIPHCYLRFIKIKLTLFRVIRLFTYIYTILHSLKAIIKHLLQSNKQLKSDLLRLEKKLIQAYLSFGYINDHVCVII